MILKTRGYFLLVLRFLAKNYRCMSCNESSFSWKDATVFIPLPWRKYVSQYFPIRCIHFLFALYGSPTFHAVWSVSAICPVKLVVSSSLKSYPCFMSRQLRRLLEKVWERLILDGWCNFSELSSKFLAVSHGVFPFPGWNVEDFHNELNFLGKLIVIKIWRKTTS